MTAKLNKKETQASSLDADPNFFRGWPGPRATAINSPFSASSLSSPAASLVSRASCCPKPGCLPESFDCRCWVAPQAAPELAPVLPPFAKLITEQGQQTPSRDFFNGIHLPKPLTSCSGWLQHASHDFFRQRLHLSLQTSLRGFAIFLNVGLGCLYLCLSLACELRPSPLLAHRVAALRAEPPAPGIPLHGPRAAAVRIRTCAHRPRQLSARRLFHSALRLATPLVEHAPQRPVNDGGVGERKSSASRITVGTAPSSNSPSCRRRLIHWLYGCTVKWRAMKTV